MTRDEEWLLEEKYNGIATPEFETDRDRLAHGEPVAYVIGWQPFLGLKIYLDSKPLIPRVETEWWTKQLLEHVSKDLTERLAHSGTPAARSSMAISAPEGGCAEICEGEAEHDSSQEESMRFPNVQDSQSYTFLDLCSGSGTIGCAALARLPHAQIYFGELDARHDATIRRNIRGNGLDESRATIGIGDLFEPFADLKFDVIAANPPYLPAERPLPQSVAEYEPALALTAGNDGLDIIRRIATELPNHLKKGGIAWIECDSAHASDACALFAAQGMRSDIRTDQYDRPRVVVVQPVR